MSSSNLTAPSEKGGYTKIYRLNRDTNAATTSSTSKPEQSSRSNVVPESYYADYRNNSDAARGAHEEKTPLADELGLSEDGYYFGRDEGYRPRTEGKKSDTQEVKHQMTTSESVKGRDGSNCNPDEEEREGKKKGLVYREGKSSGEVERRSDLA